MWKSTVIRLAFSVTCITGCATSDSDPIVGQWHHSFSDGTAEELEITDNMTGRAILYWYDSSWAIFDVTVEERYLATLRSEGYEVTLRCTQTKCSDAEAIVMGCPLSNITDTRMSCIGLRGGYDDNYRSHSFEWSK